MRALCGKDALRGRAPWRRFLPSFGSPCFQIFRGGPLLPAGGGNLRFTSPILLLRGDLNSPGLDAQCVRPTLGLPTLPFIFLWWNLTYCPFENHGHCRTGQAFGKRGRTPDPLRLTKPILVADSIQNNAMTNIIKVFGYRVTYLGI